MVHMYIRNVIEIAILVTLAESLYASSHITVKIALENDDETFSFCYFEISEQ